MLQHMLNPVEDDHSHYRNMCTNISTGEINNKWRALKRQLPRNSSNLHIEQAVVAVDPLSVAEV